MPRAGTLTPGATIQAKVESLVRRLDQATPIPPGALEEPVVSFSVGDNSFTLTGDDATAFARLEAFLQQLAIDRPRLQKDIGRLIRRAVVQALGDHSGGVEQRVATSTRELRERFDQSRIKWTIVIPISGLRLKPRQRVRLGALELRIATRAYLARLVRVKTNKPPRTLLERLGFARHLIDQAAAKSRA